MADKLAAQVMELQKKNFILMQNLHLCMRVIRSLAVSMHHTLPSDFIATFGELHRTIMGSELNTIEE